MPCRVGITTDLVSRKNYWQSQHPTLRNWTVLHNGLTREEAQAKENYYASNYRCQASGGGNDPDKPKSWSVYRFDY